MDALISLAKEQRFAIVREESNYGEIEPVISGKL